ncbi:MAG: DMT family transporter [Rhodoferax sp.]|nr:DMT family transporter [Rhodoferax sp.]
MQALWMVLASLLFALMAVGIKFASESFGTLELVFYRGVVSLVFMAVVLRVRGVSPRTSVPWMHVWRGVIGVTALGSWFYSIGRLPLATAVTLNYMSSVWVAAFVVGGALLYGRLERQGALMGTVLLGFVGVVLTLRPTIEQHQLFAGLIGLFSGMCAALAYLQVTALGKAGEPEVRTVFYFSVSAAIAGVFAALFSGLTPWTHVKPVAAAWVIPIGILASVAQWCMTRAYSKGATLVVASMQYAGIVFAAIFSLTLFGDPIPPIGWVGIATIVASGIMATALRSRAVPSASVEVH